MLCQNHSLFSFLNSNLNNIEHYVQNINNKIYLI